MQPEYQDVCSACKQPAVKVKRVSSRSGSARYVTGCCQAKPVAVKKET